MQMCAKTIFSPGRNHKKCNNSYIWREAFTSLSVPFDTIYMLPTYMHSFYF